MNTTTPIWCALLPCSHEQRWAVPQRCLGEVVSIPNADTNPPEYIEWRSQTVPVLDLDPENGPRWKNERTGIGIVAVILGLPGEGPSYWGLALRGEKLGIEDLARADITDAPDQVAKNASAAFMLDEILYQVPDLPRWQQQIGGQSEQESPHSQVDKESSCDANKSG